MWSSRALDAKRSAKALRHGASVMGVARRAIAMMGVAQGFRRPMKLRWATIAFAAVVSAAIAAAQTPAPVARVTFKDAIDLAVAKNPSVAAAASGIVRAEGLIRQARAATL